VLLGGAAIVVDLSLARVYQMDLHNAAEAAAHAAAAQLDGTDAGLTSARDKAVEMAAANVVARDPVSLDRNESNDPAGNVVLGYWDGAQLVPSSDASQVTAVQVLARRDDFLSVFAEVAFGQEHLTAGDFAIAQAGGPEVSDCPFPLALPDCELAAVSAGGCNENVVLNGDQVDNGAWARLGTSQPTAKTIRDSLDPAVCGSASAVGDQVTLNNGQIANGLKELASAINTRGIPWDASAWGAEPTQLPRSDIKPYGKVMYGQVMVFADPAGCVQTKYTGSHPITGYATAVVYDVVSTTGSKTIKMRIACDEAPETGGGAYFGTTVPPRFVR
jgi:hypothetical protein